MNRDLQNLLHLARILPLLEEIVYSLVTPFYQIKSKITMMFSIRHTLQIQKNIYTK